MIPMICCDGEMVELEIVEIIKLESESNKKDKKETTMNGKFNGWIACFTGVRMSDDEATAFANGGGIEKSGVSKGVTHLVCKDMTSTSGKMKKANDIGAKIVSMDEFRNMTG